MTMECSISRVLDDASAESAVYGPMYASRTTVPIADDHRAAHVAALQHRALADDDAPVDDVSR